MQGENSKEAKRGTRLILASIYRQKKLTFTALLAGLIWTVSKTGVPLLIESVINKGVVKGSLSQLFFWSGAVAVAGLVQGAASGLRRYNAFSMAFHVETDLRQRLFAHLQRLHMAFHDQAQTGQLMSRAASDLEQVSNLCLNFPITVSSAVIVVVTAVILVIINPILALLTLGTLPFFLLMARFYTKKIGPVTLELQQELGKMATLVEESVVGIRAVKGFGAQEVIQDRAKERADGILKKALQFAYFNASRMPLLYLLPAMAPVAVLWYGGYQVIDGKLTPGALVAFLSYVAMLITPLRMVGFFITLLPRSRSAASRVNEILSLSPVIKDLPGARHVDVQKWRESSVGVEFIDVTFSYDGREEPVLKNFNLKVEPGTSIALVGATASGKSTVIKLIPRFYDVNSGSLKINDLDVKEIRLTDLRKLVGLVFEDTFLFTDTVAANIAFALPNAEMDDIRRAAALSGADEFINNLPSGYSTLLGERGVTLSGGQRQRIALARAILGDPPILVLDDATSAVDPSKEHEIVEAMATVMQGRTTIMIAHRPSTISLADKVAFLHDGKVMAFGAHAELLDFSAEYRHLMAKLESEKDDISGGQDVISGEKIL